MNHINEKDFFNFRKLWRNTFYIKRDLTKNNYSKYNSSDQPSLSLSITEPVEMSW